MILRYYDITILEAVKLRLDKWRTISRMPRFPASTFTNTQNHHLMHIIIILFISYGFRRKPSTNAGEDDLVTIV